MKQEIRHTIRQALAGVDREAESRAIRATIRATIPAEGGVLAYEPLKDEPDISPIIEELRIAGRLVLVAGDRNQPRLEPDNLPVVLALVPGRAFDRSGNRIGRGGGTFDRILATLTCRKIGVCFACQIVERVPAEPHDIRMDEVVSG